MQLVNTQLHSDRGLQPRVTPLCVGGTTGNLSWRGKPLDPAALRAADIFPRIVNQSFHAMFMEHARSMFPAAGAHDISVSVAHFYDTFTFALCSEAVDEHNGAYGKARFRRSGLLPNNSTPTSSHVNMATALESLDTMPRLRPSLWVKGGLDADGRQLVRRSGEIVAVFSAVIDVDDAVSGVCVEHEVDLLLLNYHRPLARRKVFKSTRLSRQQAEWTAEARQVAFEKAVQYGSVEVFGGCIPLPVDAGHEYMAADVVILSEEFAIMPANGRILGVADIYPCFAQARSAVCPGVYGAVERLPTELSDDDFLRTYTVLASRQSLLNHAYLLRAAPRL